MINNYLGLLGLLTFVSGRYIVRFLLSNLGTSLANHVGKGVLSVELSLTALDGILSSTIGPDLHDNPVIGTR